MSEQVCEDDEPAVEPEPAWRVGMRAADRVRCLVDPEHPFHGTPRGACDGPWPRPKSIPDPVPCARCSTGFPIEHDLECDRW